MQLEQVLIVSTGTRRYAVVRRNVRGLHRITPQQPAAVLAVLLGEQAAPQEEIGIVLADTADDAMLRVEHADLHEQLPSLQLPPLIAHHVHPAVRGLVLYGSELLPLVDLTRLNLQPNDGLL
jgi:hypothetical protein